MNTIKLKSGFEGTIVERFSNGHKDIRPPYSLDGGFTLKGVNGHIGYIRVLPPTIKETIYPNEVLYSEIV